MIKCLLLLSIPLVIMFLLLPGCISPKVGIHKTIYVAGTGKEAITINMNSGTTVDAEAKQDFEDLIDATMPLR